jgi:hypothetical protein
MPRYLVEEGGKKYVVEADDPQSARLKAQGAVQSQTLTKFLQGAPQGVEVTPEMQQGERWRALAERVNQPMPEPVRPFTKSLEAINEFRHAQVIPPGFLQQNMLTAVPNRNVQEAAKGAGEALEGFGTGENVAMMAGAGVPALLRKAGMAKAAQAVTIPGLSKVIAAYFGGLGLYHTPEAVKEAGSAAEAYLTATDENQKADAARRLGSAGITIPMLTMMMKHGANAVIPPKAPVRLPVGQLEPLRPDPFKPSAPVPDNLAGLRETGMMEAGPVEAYIAKNRPAPQAPLPPHTAPKQPVLEPIRPAQPALEAGQVKTAPAEQAGLKEAPATPAPAITEAPAKQPWEMTKREWLDDLIARYDSEIAALEKRGTKKANKSLQAKKTMRSEAVSGGSADGHRWQVEQAIASGRPVPPEVLADYPDLAPAAKQPWEISETTSKGVVKLSPSNPFDVKDQRYHTVPDYRIRKAGDMFQLIRDSIEPVEGGDPKFVSTLVGEFKSKATAKTWAQEDLHQLFPDLAPKPSLDVQKAANVAREIQVAKAAGLDTKPYSDRLDALSNKGDNAGIDALSAELHEAIRVAAKKPTAEVKPAKEPWEMTREEWIEATRKKLEPTNVELKAKGFSGETKPNENAHYYTVKHALEKGKPVPVEVLKDYPDLKPSQKVAPIPDKPSFPARENKPLQEKPTAKVPDTTTPMPPHVKGKKPYEQSYAQWMNRGENQIRLTNLPEVAQPTPRSSLTISTETLNGPKNVRVTAYELPGYKGPQLAVQTYKLRGKEGYRVYTKDGGFLLEDSNTVSTLNDTLKLSVQRLERGAKASTGGDVYKFIHRAMADRAIREGKIQSHPEYSDIGKKAKPTPKVEIKPEPKSVNPVPLKEQKASLLAQVDNAITVSKVNGQGNITFDVPGDGKFTIKNNTEALREFRATVQKRFKTTLPGPTGPSAAQIRASEKAIEYVPSPMGKPSTKPTSAPKKGDLDNLVTTPEGGKQTREMPAFEIKPQSTLREVADLPYTVAQKAIVDTLIAHDFNPKIRLIDDPAFKHHAAWNGSDGILLNKAKLADNPQFAVRALVHEAVHDATHAAIRNPQNAPHVQRLQELFNYAAKKHERNKGKHGGSSIEHAFKNLDEFITGAFTDGKVRRLLSEMVIGERTGIGPYSKPVTVFKKFMDIVANMLGLGGKRTVLEEVVKVGDELVASRTKADRVMSSEGVVLRNAKDSMSFKESGPSPKKGGEAYQAGVSPVLVDKAWKESVDKALRLYYERQPDRLARQGQGASREFARKSNEIIDLTKQYFGRMAETLDPALKAVGRPGKATRWLNSITPSKKNPDAGYRNVLALDVNEGGKVGKIPQVAHEVANLFDDANRAHGRLYRTEADPTFVESGKIARIITPQFMDAIVRGRGELHDKAIRIIASENGIEVGKVEQMFADTREALNNPATDGGSILRKVSQEFSRTFQYMPTHIKVNGQWVEIRVSKPFEYLSQSAARTASRTAFKKLVTDEQLMDYQKKIAQEGAEPKETFDGLVRALHGMPEHNTASRFVEPGGALDMSVVRPVGSALKVVRALNLSASAVANTAEIPFGGVAQQFGPRLALKGAREAYRLRPEIEAQGGINRLIYDWSSDPVHPIHNAARVLSQGIDRASMRNFLNEFQELHAAATAKVAMEMAMEGKLSKGQKNAVYQTAKKFGFDETTARQLSEGVAPPSKTQEFIRKAPTELTGGFTTQGQKSFLGRQPWFHELFWFQQYPMMKVNHVFKTLDNLYRSPNKYQASRDFARVMYGTASQGALTALAGAYLFNGGTDGMRVAFNEAVDEPGQFLIRSLMYGIGGPASMVFEAFRDPDVPKAKDLTAQATAPGRVYDEMTGLIEALAGDGQGAYKDQTPNEAIVTFFTKSTPALRAFKSVVATVGLSNEDTKLMAASKALNRWKADKLPKGSGWAEPKTENHAEFRRNMRRAVNKLQRGESPFSEVAEAVGYKVKDTKNIDKALASVKQSLRGRKLLVDRNGSELNSEQIADLEKRIGKAYVHRLMAHDAMIEALADAL